MTAENSIRDVFVAEASERLQTLTQSVLAWEKAPRDPAPLVGILRELHTLKGTARMVGCEAIGELAHTWETFCQPFRQGGAPTPKTFKQLLGGIDALRREVEAIAKPAAKPAKSSKRRAQDGFVRLPIGRVEELVGLAGEVTVESGRTEQWIGAIRSLRQQLAMLRRRLGWSGVEQLPGVSGQAAATLSKYAIDLERLDRDLGNLVEGARASAWHLQTVSTDLQGVVGQMRLVALEAAVAELPRAARDVAAERQKEVEVVLEGTSIGIDRALIEPVKEALVHLVRNAVDHGIETPSERRVAGKAARGTLAVRAATSGNTVTIIVEDDGRGIDPERVVARAVSMRLISGEAALRLTGRERLGLIFKPGLTTAEQVTEISGRGVGLDVVQAALARCGGSVQVESERGRGARFTLRLPSSLTMRSLLLGRWDHRYVAVPLTHVQHCRQLDAAQAGRVCADGVWREGGVSLPVHRFGAAAGGVGGAVLVVVRLYGTDLGLLWDEVVGVEELRVQGLEGQARVPDVEAVSTLPSGEVVQVIDLAMLVKRYAMV